MVNFEESYHFSWFQRGFNIFQGGGGVQLFPGGSTEGVQLLIPYSKVSKGAKIRNQYNQVPHLIQDTNGKVYISIYTHISCSFPGGGGPDPCPPSGSTLAYYMRNLNN